MTVSGLSAALAWVQGPSLVAYVKKGLAQSLIAHAQNSGQKLRARKLSVS
jgi:hypothetical protein